MSYCLSARRWLYAAVLTRSIQSPAFRIAASLKWMKHRIKWFKFAAKARIRKSKICSATKTDFASAPQKSGSRSSVGASAKFNYFKAKVERPQSGLGRALKYLASNLNLAPLHALMHFIYLVFSCVRRLIELLLARWNFKISSPNMARN